MAKQLELFRKIEAQRVTMPITVYRDGDRYRAEMLGGWWMAFGDTAEKAIKNVVSRYRKEREYYAR
jgi:acyl-coenzyme A synthetase/AMP-(fatty) acid ligase